MKKALLPLSLMLALNMNPATADDLATFQDDSRKVVKELVGQLGSKVQSEMMSSGPVGTISVCKVIAPMATSEISRKTGQRVTRVSLKVRNPLLGMPDAWEQTVLMNFEKRLTEKESPANMEFAEVVTEPQGKYLRYMKAIPTQEVCLKCHGAPDAIAAPVKEVLNADYPHDKAIGYTLGQIRGAISIKKPM
ncbi:MAG: DUF3365 domain-containing protein [Sulfuricellaceae bacterium]